MVAGGVGVVEPSRRIAGRGRRAGDHATGGRVAPAAVERSGRPSAGSPSSRRVASVMLCRMPARPSSARPRRRDSVWWRRSAGTRSSSWAAGAHPAPRHRRARRDAAPGSDAGHRLLETRMALRRDRRRWPRARGRCDADRGGARRPEPVPLPDRGRRLRQWRHVGGHVPGGATGCSCTITASCGAEGRLVEAEPFPIGDRRPLPQLPIWAVALAVATPACSCWRAAARQMLSDCWTNTTHATAATAAPSCCRARAAPSPTRTASSTSSTKTPRHRSSRCGPFSSKLSSTLAAPSAVRVAA
jgi:hypothetical protein